MLPALVPEAALDALALDVETNALVRSPKPSVLATTVEDDPYFVTSTDFTSVVGSDNHSNELSIFAHFDLGDRSFRTSWPPLADTPKVKVFEMAVTRRRPGTQC